MKHLFYTISLILVFIYLFLGCGKETISLPPVVEVEVIPEEKPKKQSTFTFSIKQYHTFEDLRKRVKQEGYDDLLNVNDSKAWLKRNGHDIKANGNLPNSVIASTNCARIAIDERSNLRVILKSNQNQ